MYKILVIVDMQNDFLDENVLGNQECRNVVPQIVRKVADEQYDQIILTRDTHSENYLDTQEGKNLPVKHCIRGTQGWQISSEIREAVRQLSNVKIIDKPTFGSMELAEEVARAAEQEEIAVELTGVCTGICVISNALLIKARNPEVPVAVDASCCACVTPQSHQTALDAMQLCQIEIRNG